MRFTLLLLSFHSLLAVAQLSGTYDVGGPTPDFTAIQPAIDALEQAGVAGHVVLKIHPGTYTTALDIQPIPGVNPNATVTIEAANPGANDVTFTMPGDLVNDLCYIGSAYVAIDGLTFLTTASSNPSFGHSVMDIRSDHVTIRNCTLVNQFVLSNSLFLLYASDVEDLEIKNNTLRNEVTPTPLSFGVGISITNGSDILIGSNHLSAVVTGINILLSDGIEIRDNILEDIRPDTTTPNGFSRGMTLALCTDVKVKRNKIEMRKRSDAIGIILGGEDLPGDTREIVNNMISIIQVDGATPLKKPISNDVYPSGITVALHGPNVSDLTAPPVSTLLISHNSLYIETDHHAGIRLEHPVAGETQVTSNSIRMVGDTLTGLSYRNNTAAPWPISDYNNVSLFGTNNLFGLYATKALIVANTTMEDNSISRVPDYFSKTDLHIKESSPNINRAFVQPGVTQDYDKDPRQHFDPQYDIGADEYGNLGAKSLVIAAPPTTASEPVRPYPNPTADAFSLELPTDHAYSYTLFSADGRAVRTGLAMDRLPILVDDLPNGTYILHLNDLPASATRLMIAR